MQVRRIEPIISVDSAGNVNWQNAPLQYDPALFYSGKKITNEVFNDLFVKQTSHGNYTSDTLKQFLTTHLPTAIFRQVQNRFKFTEHYTRVFNSTDWKGPDSKGYYYIDIPATEHGVYVADDENMQATVRVEMYALDSNGNFYNIKQFDIDNDNGVRLYTDDTALIGYVIIALSNKAYAVVNQGKIDVSQIEGLSPVAVSGNYSDLNGVPDEDVTALTNDITGLKNGTITAGKALVAEDVEHILEATTFAGIPYLDIFEKGSSYVKNATHAMTADSAANATKFDSKTFDELKKFFLNTVYPVGSVYVSTSKSVDPERDFGGKWTPINENHVLWTASSSQTAGVYLTEQLPNIEGSFKIRAAENEFSIPDIAWSGTGAFTVGAKTGSGVSVEVYDDAAGKSEHTITFSAAESNNIYNGEHVRPAAYTVYAWVRTS